MNLSELTIEELEQLRLSVLAELERRASLETIPEQINQLTKAYVEAGGDLKDISGSL